LADAPLITTILGANEELLIRLFKTVKIRDQEKNCPINRGLEQC